VAGTTLIFLLEICQVGDIAKMMPCTFCMLMGEGKGGVQLFFFSILFYFWWEQVAIYEQKGKSDCYTVLLLILDLANSVLFRIVIRICVFGKACACSTPSRRSVSSVDFQSQASSCYTIKNEKHL